MTDSLLDSSLDGDEDNVWEEGIYYGRDGHIFLIDCDDTVANVMENVKKSVDLVEKMMMSGIIASNKTMVSWSYIE